MGTKVSLPYVPDYTRDAIFSDVDTSLASFFERPIVIRSYTWTPLQGAPFTGIFNPWTDFFGNPRVINRINNYNLMRARLNVRFTINGNGFYYGRLMADYLPLTNDNVTAAATLVTQNAIQASQRMKVFIDPSTCCSNEMELPFVWYRDGVSIPDAEWSQLGNIYIRELNGLKHANAATQPVTITVFAWASEVQMSLPTSVESSALVNQAGEDEYATPGPVQATASAVASMAGALTKLPIIGGYARATQIAAGAASKAASVMGWSRPAIIEPHSGMTPRYVSDLAPADAGDNVAKLTIDSKQEVTVDPNVIGIDLPDELSIAGIAARESYLTSYLWTTARVGGDLLWTNRVTPFIGDISGATVYMPACAYAVYPFGYWHGKMRYRFQIVASAYHKGRLRLVWDPAYVQSVEGNVQFTKIIDISEERDVTVEIDWGQTAKFLPVPTSVNSLISVWQTTPQYASSAASANGVLSVYVLNDLATPNSTVNNDISVNVFVSAVDLQVAAPRSFSSTVVNTYAATVQAGEDMDMVATGDEPGCGAATSNYKMAEDTDDPNDAAVYFGERIVSFRQILKRYNEHSTFLIANTSATIPAIWTPIMSDVPFFYGFNNSTLHTTTAAGKFSYVNMTMLHYLMPAFAAMRGSHRSKYVVNTSSHGAAGSLTVARTSATTAALPVAATPLAITSQSAYARAATPVRDDCMVGAVTTIVANQPALEVEFPYYKPVRFDEPRWVLQATVTANYSSPFRNTHRVELALSPGTTPVTLTRYISVGEDFGLYWFQGCPPLQVLAPPA